MGGMCYREKWGRLHLGEIWVKLPSFLLTITSSSWFLLFLLLIFSFFLL